MKSIQTCLMFAGEQAGRAEEAMNLYTSLFAKSEIVDIVRHEGSDHDKDGTIQTAMFTLNGCEFIAMDSALEHQFTFTPSMSLYVECESEEELEAAYKAYADGGIERMPLDNYGFSQKFGWVDDRYGVSWQLNLA